MAKQLPDMSEQEILEKMLDLVALWKSPASRSVWKLLAGELVERIKVLREGVETLSAKAYPKPCENPGLDGDLAMCGEPGAFRYTWPGKPESVACEKHAAMIRKVAEAIDLPLQFVSLTGCNDCEPKES